MNDGPVQAKESKRRFWPWAAAAVVGAALALSMVAEWPARLPFTPCLFRNVTGLPCPGCGMTHGFVAMGHGRFREAWNSNPLSPFAYGFAAGYVVFLVLRRLVPAIDRIRPGRAFVGVFYGTVLVAVLASWGTTLAVRFAALP